MVVAAYLTSLLFRTQMQWK